MIEIVSIVLVYIIINIWVVQSVDTEMFHLLSLRKLDGSRSNIVHHWNSNSGIQALCLQPKSFTSSALDSVSHEICRKQGYVVAQNYKFVNRKLFSGKQNQYTLIDNTFFSADIKEVDLESTDGDNPSCTHFWEVECGECWFSYVISDNSDVEIRSPLYPALPDKIICNYELSSHKKIEIDIEKLGLHPPVEHIVDGRRSRECLNSFLLILPIASPGTSGAETIGLAHQLCGNVANKVIQTNSKQVRLILASVYDDNSLQEGFIINVSTVKSKAKVVEIVIVLLGILSPVVCFICVFFYHKMNCGKWKGSRNSGRRAQRRRPGGVVNAHRHSAWVGDLPRHGETLHQARTMRLQRYLEPEENNYVMDNRISRNTSAQRPLPLIPQELGQEPPPSRPDSNNNSSTATPHQLPRGEVESLYQHLHGNDDEGKQHLYLTLINSGSDSIYEQEYIGSPLENNFSKDMSRQGEAVVPQAVHNLHPRISTSTAIEPFKQEERAGHMTGITEAARRLSTLGSRIASLASYASLKRKDTNRVNDESVHLLENEDLSETGDDNLALENIEESQIADAENDDVFQENV